MRPLQITLFVIGLIVLGTQSLRHVYVRWIEPTGSVLDEYRDEVEDDIAEAKDLDELVGLYDEAHAKVEVFEADPASRLIPPSERHGQEPWWTKERLKRAIERWEAQESDVFELFFYWTVALAGILLGLLAYTRVNRWLGMVGIIAGFAEMALWTNPLWRAWGPQAQFERLLAYKLALSLVSTVLLIALWLLAARRRRKALDL